MLQFNSPFNIFVRSFIQKYNHERYWTRRSKVIDPNDKTPKIIKLLWLLLIKRSDAFNCASFGTNLNSGANFLSPPHLPHGLNGIIIGHDVKVGLNCTIYQQVTIAHGNVVIGDNCLIGAGAKILPNVKIGNNVKIGANCVVVEDIPDNATVVMSKPRVIVK